VQTSPSGVTQYFSGFGVLAEKFGQLGAPQRWTNYLIVGGRLVGIHVENAARGPIGGRWRCFPSRWTTTSTPTISVPRLAAFGCSSSADAARHDAKS
jgi:hypothetical protein